MFKFHKKLFCKLYRYYLRKTCGIGLLCLFFMLILTLTGSLSFIRNFRLGEGNICNETWKICLAKSLPLFYLGSVLISNLVWETILKKEDGAILTTASPLNRQTILIAKLASVFAYFGITNLAVNLPILLASASTGTNGLIFLLLDSFCLAGVIFLLFYTPLFYFGFPTRQRGKKFLLFLFYGILLFTYAILTLHSQLPLLKAPGIPLGLSLPVGGIFLSLYGHNFRRHDYT